MVIQDTVHMTRVPEATSLIGSYYPNHDEDNIWISGCRSLCSGHFQNTYSHVDCVHNLFHRFLSRLILV